MPLFGHRGTKQEHKRYTPPLLRYRVKQSHVALCFPGIAPYRAIPPIRNPIAHTFVTYNALQLCLYADLKCNMAFDKEMRLNNLNRDMFKQFRSHRRLPG